VASSQAFRGTNEEIELRTGPNGVVHPGPDVKIIERQGDRPAGGTRPDGGSKVVVVQELSLAEGGAEGEGSYAPPKTAAERPCNHVFFTCPQKIASLIGPFSM